MQTIYKNLHFAFWNPNKACRGLQTCSVGHRGARAVAVDDGAMPPGGTFCSFADEATTRCCRILPELGRCFLVVHFSLQ